MKRDRPAVELEQRQAGEILLGEGEQRLALERRAAGRAEVRSVGTTLPPQPMQADGVVERGRDLLGCPRDPRRQRAELAELTAPALVGVPRLRRRLGAIALVP